MSFRSFARVAIIAAVAGCAAPSISRADLLTNGGFELMPNWNNGSGGDGSYTLFTASNAIPGWTIQAGYGATIHNTITYPTISGSYSLNTDGEGFNGHNVNIYQDFAAVLDGQFALTFDWMNWSTSTAPRLNVTITDTVTNTVLVFGDYGVLPGLHSETLAFVGTGNTLRLRIQHAPESGFNDNTFIVDNFAVNAVPAPAAAMMLGLCGVLAAGRRRR